MPALDTNVLVRYLVIDDEKQYKSAKKFIESQASNDALFVSTSVAVELEWVLRSLYDIDKFKMLTTFNQLLESREIEFQDESCIEIAISLYADTNADFADCLHVASALSCDRTPLTTFDRKASRLDGAHLLE